MSKKKTDAKQSLPIVKTGEQSKKWFYLIIIAFSFILYGNSISNNYALDDEIVTLGNKRVEKGIAGIPEIFTTHFVESSKQSYGYRPMVLVSFAIENQFFKQNAHVSHFVNILLYAFTGIVLFLLLIDLLKNYHKSLPILATLIFIAHPIHTEVVDNIKCRDDLLSLLFILLATIRFLKYYDTSSNKHLVFGFLFSFLGFTSKVSCATFFVAIPMIVYFFRDKIDVKKLGITAATVLLVYISFLLMKKFLVGKEVHRQMLYFENPLFYDKNFIHRIAAGFYTLYYYLKLLVFPHPLLYYYGYSKVELPNILNPIVILCASATGGMIVYTIKHIKEKSLLIFCFLFFVVTISMFLSVVVPAVGIIGERFAYIASISFCIALSWVIYKISNMDIKNHKAELNNKFYGIVIVLLLLYSSKVISRNKDWKDHMTLYSHDIQNLSESAKAHALLSARIIQEVNQGKFQNQKEEKIKEVVYNYQEALRIYPDYVTTLNNLGSVFFIYYQDYKTALPYFKRSIELDSSYTEAFFNLASTYDKLGEPEYAEENYKKSLKIDSAYINSYVALTKFYIAKGRQDDAVNINKQAIDKGIQPGMMYINLGNIYLANQDTVKAINYYENAVANKQYNLNLCNFIASYYNEKKDYQKTSYYLDIAKSLKNQAQ